MHHRYLNSTTPCTFTVRVSGRYERREHPRRRKAQSRCVERAQEGKPWVSRSRLVTPVANPKVSIQGWRWGVESRVEGAHSSLRHELRALSALRTHMRAHTHTHRHTLPIHACTEPQPNATCSLTKFWQLHHSFKIAKSAKRNYILRTVTSAGGQVMR